MNLVDSCVLVSYFRTEESNHRKAIQLVEKLKNITISDYVFLEVSTVLLMRENKEIAQKATKIITNNKDIEMIRLTRDELDLTIQMFQRQAGTLSFVDISLLVLKKTRKATLYTFDEKLQNSVL